MRIELDSVTKEMKGTRVLDGVSLALEGGRAYGLRGKNGSGKTMLLRAMAGLVRPTAGTVLVGGEALPPGRFPPSIGVLIENPAFIPQYTGFKNLWYLARIRGELSPEDVRLTLARIGLDPADRRPFRKYSLGMKQRLGIACAVMEKPDLVLLDEPTNALDPSGVEMAKRIIREERDRGALVVVACHDREELDSFADEVFVMAEGRIVDHEMLRGEGR